MFVLCSDSVHRSFTECAVSAFVLCSAQVDTECVVPVNVLCYVRQTQCTSRYRGDCIHVSLFVALYLNANRPDITILVDWA